MQFGQAAYTAAEGDTVSFGAREDLRCRMASVKRSNDACDRHATDEAVTITDDDVPSVTVSFGSAAYTVAESDDSDTTDVTENTVEVTVTLSADPSAQSSSP